MKVLLQILIFCLGICCVVGAKAQGVEASSQSGSADMKYKVISYSKMHELIDEGGLVKADINQHTGGIYAQNSNGISFSSRGPMSMVIAEKFVEAGVETRFYYRSPEQNKLAMWEEVLINLLPLIIFMVFLILLLPILNSSNKSYWMKQEEFSDRFFLRLEENFKKARD